jgi:uncharacterized membrane protein
MQKRNKKEYLILFIKSILMGTANKLPGISGGLVALITGFYDEMIKTFKNININLLKHIFIHDFKKLENQYNFIFIVVVVLGIVVSYFTTSKVLDYFFKLSELNVWSFFYGMIIASLAILLRENKISNNREMLFLSIGLMIGIILSFSEPIEENQNIFFVFICGMISICGMIIPGISGSFLLILLGNYKLLLVDSVNELINLLYFTFGIDSSINVNFNLIKILIVFSLGSLIGLSVLSKLLNYLITNYKNIINQIIIGFVSGSLFIVWPWKKVIIENTKNVNKIINSENNSNYFKYLPDITENSNITALACIIFGFIIVLYIEKYASRKKNIRPSR